MTKKYNYAVFIGRFQPLHLGHQVIIDEGLKIADKVIVLVGSAGSSRSFKNPFTYDERVDMIRVCYPIETDRKQIITAPLYDAYGNDTAWVAATQATVQKIVLDDYNRSSSHWGHGMNDIKIALIGHDKDATSFYLKLFPDWDSVLDIPHRVWNSTDIRKAYFTSTPVISRHCLDKKIYTWLNLWMQYNEKIFDNLVTEKKYIDDYKAAWAAAPYPPVFVTVDAVVVQSGYILLVRRGESPGKGLLALPGGFVNQYEQLRDAVVRELKEETAISDAKGEIPPAMLGSFIDDSATRVFDYPFRSQRGRTITHAYLFKLPNSRTMYTIKGSDDAAHAEWYKLGDLDSTMMFEDHYTIIKEMLRL